MSGPGPKIAIALLTLFVVLASLWTFLIHRVDSATDTPATVALSSVSGGGITLTSDRITLPDETAALPAGSDLITANCTACHSTEMIATQPVLNAEKWQATIDKMRGVYKAPVSPNDDKALIAELLALPTQQPAK